MIRKLIPFLLVASLAACANTGGSRTSSAPASSSSDASSSVGAGTSYGSSSAMPGSTSGKTCDAGPLQSQIGQKATPSVMEDLRTRSGSTTARMLRPGQVVTMEYNNTRLNLIVDDKDVMTAIRCG
ncbi:MULTISPECIES: I78 family peptidase inhibitor [unclassified Achromobacter]|uniref:I78 family peptidase inhibitor n=1 Tax=unclassified Achromobacter TaxID=2626865 RepID=UPI0008BE80E5|nr:MULTISPECIES: I78 family peptidase inhibitor [unclassified Achromobacter]SEI39436.1 Peptidase inhibitor I78 family protein [Achromobacter sp. NFACC18-2]SIT31816.1 Peptidase inhibitor I78 family protein [Achromobacter sp. MFA1 R4]